MKPYVIAAIAGLLCLPATVNIERLGPFSFVPFIYMAIGLAGGLLAMSAFRRGEKRSVGRILAAFAAGAFCSDMILYSFRYFDFGIWGGEPDVFHDLLTVTADFGVTILLGGGAFFVAASIFGSVRKRG